MLMKITRKILSFLLTHCKTSFLDEMEKTQNKQLNIVNTDLRILKELQTKANIQHTVFW